jgi:uncharacterized protein YecE (DUF72 family)
MPAKVHIGCCGWSYLNENEFPEIAGYLRVRSKLQAYAYLFDTVEINSTFYRLPRVSTAQKWRKEVDEVNPGFEFTVKAFQGITHLHKFRKTESVNSYEVIKDICLALNAKLVLFQTPASFGPSKENVDAMLKFFEKIDRHGVIAVWEPRGKWYNEESLIKRVCSECDLIHCVDPFRNEPLAFGDSGIAYFRLHGFGKPSMYRYDFSYGELQQLHDKVVSLRSALRDVYVYFNNDACYDNGRVFAKMLE